MSHYSAGEFQKIAFLVKKYSPDVRSKNNADVDLLKCFMLDRVPDFIQLLHEIK